MTSNTPTENQKRWVGSSPRQTSITPKQRVERDREERAREVENLREHQARLKADFYRRSGLTPPEGSAA